MREGRADLVAFGRPFLANPDLRSASADPELAAPSGDWRRGSANRADRWVTRSRRVTAGACGCLCNADPGFSAGSSSRPPRERSMQPSAGPDHSRDDRRNRCSSPPFSQPPPRRSRPLLPTWRKPCSPGCWRSKAIGWGAAPRAGSSARTSTSSPVGRPSSRPATRVRTRHGRWPPSTSSTGIACCSPTIARRRTIRVCRRPRWTPWEPCSRSSTRRTCPRATAVTWTRSDSASWAAIDSPVSGPGTRAARKDGWRKSNTGASGTQAKNR